MLLLFVFECVTSLDQLGLHLGHDFLHLGELLLLPLLFFFGLFTSGNVIFLHQLNILSLLLQFFK